MQFRQSLGEVEPAPGLNMPTSQASHKLEPMVALKLPAGQLRQALPDADPGSGLYLPAEQLLHTVDPATSMYCPTAHATHVPSE